MFCPTTTPFRKKDVASLLPCHVPNAQEVWQLAEGRFGTEVTYGFDQTVRTPNFFDVIAMTTISSLMCAGVGSKQAVETSYSLTGYLARCWDADIDQSHLFPGKAAEVRKLVRDFSRISTKGKSCRLSHGQWLEVSRVLEKILQHAGVKLSMNQRLLAIWFE